MTECISNPEFGCACVDQDPIVCFYLRYNKNPLELTKGDVCECSCHDNFDPQVEDEQDKSELEADYDMMKEMQKSDHELEMLRQRDDIELMEREKDACDRERELRQQYPHKYQDDGDSDD
jgi:hypothetical protein